MTRAAEIRLVSPEGVPLRFQIATITERVLAVAIDLAAIFAAITAVALVAFAFGAATLLDQAVAVLLLGLFAIRHGYFVWFETRWHGATPGKRLTGLRVVSRDGGELPVSAVVARNVLRDVEVFLPAAIVAAPDAIVGEAPLWLVAPALAWIVVFAALPLFTDERTRAGDLVAGTVVVRVPRAVLLPDQADRASLRPIALTSAQLAIYGEHELETLATLLRDHDRGHASDGDLRVVAETVARKIAFEGDEPRALPALFLRAFYKAQRAALEKRLLFGERKASKHER